MVTLIGVLAPALALPLLMALCGGTRLPGLFAPNLWPVEFWCMAIAGSVATTAGVLDWRFHRGGGRCIPPAERRAEATALLAGAVAFTLLAIASFLADPGPLLLPVMVVALATAGLIAVDEARFVFAFPCALDGSSTPLRASHRLLARDRGAPSATVTVARIAAEMLFGGLRGRGFARSWCVGCIAVLLWYEAARTSAMRRAGARS